MRRVFAYGVLAAAIATAPAFARQSQQQQSGSSQQQPRAGTQTERQSGQVARVDQQFLTQMAQGGMAEVELGQLAQQKASNAQVKQFGERMVRDHGKANDELKSLASSKNVTLPTDMGGTHKGVHDKLSKLSGESFDRAYMQQMVQAHNATLERLRTHAKNGQDADIKAWASKTMPTVQEHLKLAQSLSGRAVGTSGRESDQPGTTPRGKSETPRTDPRDNPTGGGGASTPQSDPRPNPPDRNDPDRNR